ncbi:hypothetical protein PQE68_gp042 [Bacillus phage vB_BanS_Sophrita]|uniref:Uncharacterized protein n=1 Tax=Bacillus phage vB_BanS_Sophrita TaxID=2894790 RepID=A0AAE8YTT6_9CAUD|nr:hypothetical protein PQE68_gp042 [Bacillus phage vB_BanS_Sophrita]UGO50633.1 hypothetical protein SOPHRITA_42 [Bacillus phage vB_BanS_Sophrita]
MKVKYINDCHDKEFTLNKEYECQDTYNGLLIIDDLGQEHVIAKTDNKYDRYEEDDFFRFRFKFV